MRSESRPSYAALCDWSNLLLAWRRARRGKRGRPAAASFERAGAEELLALERELSERRYRPGRYRSFVVHDPKRRLISAAPFRDRVVHHALLNVVEPALERRFIHASFANRRGRGTHAALDLAQRFARRYAYVLPADVEQFFPAVDHEILLRLLARVVRDRELLDLCRIILDGGCGVLADEYRVRYFPGDDLFSAQDRARGLPIGNLTSQFWANVYLDPLDQFVQRELRCKGYLRYADDFLLFSDSKHQLAEWRGRVIDRLATLRLTLHARRCQARPVGEGLPFLGFHLFPDRRRLRSARGHRARRRLRKKVESFRAGRIGREEVQAALAGWLAHARHGDTAGLRRAVLAELLPLDPPARRSR